jgi:UDP-GlcNAc3NAcA epimerase
LEKFFLEQRPSAMLVYGDTNSTLAGALVGAKLHIPIIHIEAGLRSFNKSMPEEINRIVTDHLSSLLFAPTPHAIENLQLERITNNVFLAGDVMFDMLLLAQNIQGKSSDSSFYLATLHRPYNTDDSKRLGELLDQLDIMDLPVIFPIHPRTLYQMETFSLKPANYPNIRFIAPLSYFDNIQLLTNCAGVITDSGGMQKEAYWLKKKCLTIRPETEWVETLENGWNTLIFEELSLIPKAIRSQPGQYRENLYGSGGGSSEIVAKIISFLEAERRG